MTSIKKTEGLIAAAFTPFYPDGSVNTTMIPALVDKLIADGLRGIFVCGSNGEGPNMTTAERMLVAEEFASAAGKRIRIIVHVGHSSIAEAKILAQHAASIGADAISSVAAFYFKPLSVGNLVQCMADIAAAAPGLPFYYYHIPHLTGVSMNMIDFLDQAGSVIPNLAGIKYTATTIHEFQACLGFREGHFDILFGLDELLLPALSVGCRGAIGSTYTFAAPIYQKTIEYFNAGDLARARKNHDYMIRIIRLITRYPSIPAQKALMKMLGWELGPCRLPLLALDEDQLRRFRNELDQLSFLTHFGTRNQTT